MRTRREVLKMLATGGVLASSGNIPFIAAQTPASSELLIRHSRIVNSDSIRSADVRIVGETIAEVAANLKPGTGARVIEAAGKLLMPGGVDPHTHLDYPDFVDDFTSGSMAALAGGITTIGTFAPAEANQPIAIALEQMAERARMEAIADVFLHTVAWPPTPEVIGGMPSIVSAGQPSFKVFLSEPDFYSHIHEFIRLLEAARDAGVMTMVHCEDAALLAASVRRLEAEGRTSLANYGASRPVIAEVAATDQAIAHCEMLGAPVYIVHISSARALQRCRQARSTGAPLFTETRPAYLHLTDERLRGSEAPLFISEPPLRPEADRDQLWRALTDGTIDVLGSDHAPGVRRQKLDPSFSIRKTRPGMSDLQFMLPMFFSEGVRKRGLPLTRFVATSSTNAARIFGMYPKKGAIRPGSDADIVIWDPNRTTSITAEADLSNSDYSVYEGWKVTGWPVMTIRRGEIVYDAGRIIGKAGTGRLIRRQPWRR